MKYQAETPNLRIFLKRLVTGSLVHNYWYYVSGSIPEHKDPALTDQRIIEKYAITDCRVTRLRRKRRGLSNTQYLRLGHLFVITATEGEGLFFTNEAGIQDFRVTPLLVQGHLVGIRGGRAFVEIYKARLAEAKHRLLTKAMRAQPSILLKEVKSISWLNYSGVRGQKAKLIRRIDKLRKRQGLSRISKE